MDPLSICASVVSLAGAGIKLSTTLYTYSETAFRADRSVKEIAQDVSLTSSVLRELGTLLEQDRKENICSSNALSTASETVEGCREVFDEINAALERSMKSGGKTRISGLQRLKWPLVEPKMKLLQGNLDRLKGTLLLILNVVTYARKIAAEKLDKSVWSEERFLIENLIKSNRESAARYEILEQNVKLAALNTIVSQPENLTDARVNARGARPQSPAAEAGASVSRSLTGSTVASNSTMGPKMALTSTSRAVVTADVSIPTSSCVCGEVSEDDPSLKHITLDQLQAYENRIWQFIRSINTSKEKLGRISLSTRQNCMEVQQNFDEASRTLESILQWQTDAFLAENGPVIPQSVEYMLDPSESDPSRSYTPKLMKTERRRTSYVADVELETGINHARSRTIGIGRLKNLIGGSKRKSSKNIVTPFLGWQPRAASSNLAENKPSTLEEILVPAANLSAAETENDPVDRLLRDWTTVQVPHDASFGTDRGQPGKFPDMRVSEPDDVLAEPHNLRSPVETEDMSAFRVDHRFETW